MAITDADHKTVATEDAQPDDLDERDVRALLTPMTVMDNCGDVRGADDMFEVTTDSGSEYIVDLRTESCTCPDHEYRGVRCKHIRRVEFEIGERPIPGWVNTETLDEQLGEHVTTGEPRIVMADGSGVRSLTPKHGSGPGAGRDLETEAVDGGLLVWNHSGEKPGRRLAGFAGVDDWDAIRSELARRGHGVGAIHHLEEFDVEEVA